LKNVAHFKYLGNIFSADGSQEPDIQRRCGIATTRAGQLRHIFGSTHIDLATKLNLYNAAIGSLFTYGCEAWTLTTKTMRQLNGANSHLLTRITGKTIHEEARDPSYDLNLNIRKRRLCWLGHILRLDDHRLVKSAIRAQFAARAHLRAQQAPTQATRAQHAPKRYGTMLMDALELSLQDLEALALHDNKRIWNKMVKTLI